MKHDQPPSEPPTSTDRTFLPIPGPLSGRLSRAPTVRPRLPVRDAERHELVNLVAAIALNARFVRAELGAYVPHDGIDALDDVETCTARLIALLDDVA